MQIYVCMMCRCVKKWTTNGLWKNAQCLREVCIIESCSSRTTKPERASGYRIWCCKQAAARTKDGGCHGKKCLKDGSNRHEYTQLLNRTYRSLWVMWDPRHDSLSGAERTGCCPASAFGEYLVYAFSSAGILGQIRPSGLSIFPRDTLFESPSTSRHHRYATCPKLQLHAQRRKERTVLIFCVDS